MSVAEREHVGGGAEAGSLTKVLDAWWRYTGLRADGAPLSERLAAWEALQVERRRHRAATSGR